MITIGATISSLDHRVSKWYSAERIQFYNKDHYVTPYNVKKVQAVLKEIPKNAPVSATNGLVPHLAFRDYIYQFPVINNAEYIVILKSGNIYPMNEKEFEDKLNELNSSKEWVKVKEDENIVLFKHQ